MPIRRQHGFWHAWQVRQESLTLTATEPCASTQLYCFIMSANSRAWSSRSGSAQMLKMLSWVHLTWKSLFRFSGYLSLISFSSL
jgi:hypothetical protein